jgi:hypothetical protein
MPEGEVATGDGPLSCLAWHEHWDRHPCIKETWIGSCIQKREYRWLRCRPQLSQPLH